MPTPFNQLVEDHQHLRKLLRYLREQISHYDNPDVETDLPRVIEAMDYLSSYPQSYHHPLEEVAFDYMQARNLGDACVIDRIRRQHAELERATADVQTLFENIYADHVVPASRLKETFNHYLDMQFQHLETEDEEIFPVMNESLSLTDWEKIALEVEAVKDPLFRPGSIESYRELSESLGLR